jgi:hypothetical protein
LRAQVRGRKGDVRTWLADDAAFVVGIGNEAAEK